MDFSDDSGDFAPVELEVTPSRRTALLGSRRRQALIGALAASVISVGVWQALPPSNAASDDGTRVDVAPKANETDPVPSGGTCSAQTPVTVKAGVAALEVIDCSDVDPGEVGTTTAPPSDVQPEDAEGNCDGCKGMIEHSVGSCFADNEPEMTYEEYERWAVPENDEYQAIVDLCTQNPNEDPAVTPKALPTTPKSDDDDTDDDDTDDDAEQSPCGDATHDSNVDECPPREPGREDNIAVGEHVYLMFHGGEFCDNEVLFDARSWRVVGGDTSGLCELGVLPGELVLTDESHATWTDGSRNFNFEAISD